MAMNNPYADAMKFWSTMQTPSMPSMPTMPSMPNFDMNSVVSMGRRNAEAVTAAGQAVSESVQAISRRQAELTRQNVEKLLKTTKDMLVNGSPEINTGKQVDLARTMFEASLNNLREVSELVTKSGFEVFDVLNKRASESIEEITACAPTTSTKRKAA